MKKALIVGLFAIVIASMLAIIAYMSVPVLFSSSFDFESEDVTENQDSKEAQSNMSSNAVANDGAVAPTLSKNEQSNMSSNNSIVSENVENNIDDVDNSTDTIWTNEQTFEQMKKLFSNELFSLTASNASMYEQNKTLSNIADVIPERYRTSTNILVSVKETGNWECLYAYNSYDNFIIDDYTLLSSSNAGVRYLIKGEVTICNRVQLSQGPQLEDYVSPIMLDVVCDNRGKLMYLDIQYHW